MRTTKRIALMIVLCFLLANIASSATNHSGGGNKKQKQSTGLSFNYKKSPLTLQNGFRFRGGLTFTTTSSKNPLLQSNTVRFQKGNNLYVMPYKQKSFVSRFKTPQKEMR